MVKKVKFIKERVDSIIKHQNISEVARTLNLSISPLKRYYDRCIKEGYLTKINGEFQKGQNYSVPPNERSNHKGQILELHGIKLTIPIINPSTNWKDGKEIFAKLTNFQQILESYKPNDKIYPKQVQYDFKDIQLFHITTTSKSIILTQKKDQPLRLPLTRESPDMLKEKVINIVFNLLPILEKRFMEKLGGDFESEIRLTRQHYAELKNPLANRFVKEGIALKVYVDDRLRTLVDKSKGVIHYENVDYRESPLDAKAHTRFIENINRGHFNEEKVVDEVETIKGIQNGVKLAQKGTLEYIQETNNQSKLVTEQMKSIGQFISGTLTRQQQDISFQKGIVEQINDIRGQFNELRANNQNTFKSIKKVAKSSKSKHTGLTKKDEDIIRNIEW